MNRTYHPGELEMQRRAGTSGDARRMSQGILASVPLGMEKFLRLQRMIVIGSADAAGRAWASLLTGKAGFLHLVDEQTLKIAAQPAAGDPLAENLQAGSRAGVLVIDLAARRRLRFNGRAKLDAQQGLVLRVEEFFGNCPQYIQAREIGARAPGPAGSRPVERSRWLQEDQQGWVASADTFFLATYHPAGGADVSHRGGLPGFVRVSSSGLLVWPDYSGNGMFQSLGNVLKNPKAGLLFIDFERGRTLQLTGEAQVVEDAAGLGAFPGAQRLVEFAVHEIIEHEAGAPAGWKFIEYSPNNPE